MIQYIISVVIIILIPFSLYASTLSNSFKTEDHFTINLPANWLEIPIKKIKKHSPKFTYEYVYQDAPFSRWLDGTPYILINVINGERLNGNELKNIEKSTYNITQNIQNTIYLNDLPFNDYEITDVEYDDENHIFYSTISLSPTNGSDLYIHQASLLTESGHIDISMYLDGTHNYTLYTDLFDQIVPNIELDSQVAYSPRFSDHFLFLNPWKEKLKILKTKKFALVAMVFCLILWRFTQKRFKP